MSNWLRRTADLVEVIVTDPGATKSGVCADCSARSGQPVSKTGRPPFHPHCACKTQVVQQETQPGKVLDEFVGIEPPEPDMLGGDNEGGVEELTINL